MDLTLQWATAGRNWPERKNQFLQGPTLPPWGSPAGTKGRLCGEGPESRGPCPRIPCPQPAPTAAPQSG